jgi:cell division septal protein FtsQ
VLTPLSKVVLSVALVVTGITFAGQWLLRQSFFRVQHVTITGLHHEKYATVLASSGLSRHPTMLGLSAASVRHNLRHFTWISGVTIQKRWPNSVTLSVQESRAVAAAFTSHHVLDYVDAHGRDLGQAPLHVNLPTLVYLRPSSATWPFARAGRAAAVVAAELPPAFSSQVSKITVGAAGNVTIELTTPLSFYLGPATNLHAKFVAIASVIGHATLKPGDVVNVTVPDELSVSGPTPQ